MMIWLFSIWEDSREYFESPIPFASQISDENLWYYAKSAKSVFLEEKQACFWVYHKL